MQMDIKNHTHVQPIAPLSPFCTDVVFIKYTECTAQLIIVTEITSDQQSHMGEVLRTFIFEFFPKSDTFYYLY